jgi:hypothetical protein
MTYRVVEMYGDFEPWWFMDEWREDVKQATEFDDFNEALAFYKDKWLEFKGNTSHFNSKDDFLAAFWNDADERWCDECGDYLQQYHGLLLLEEWERVTHHPARPGYKRQSDESPARFCSPNL